MYPNISHNSMKDASRRDHNIVMQWGAVGYAIVDVMSPKPKSRSRGRPPAGDDTMQQIALRLPKPLLAAIDEFTEGRLDAPDRSAIIRELLAEAVAARRKRGRSDQG
jgi:hypothetical protein